MEGLKLLMYGEFIDERNDLVRWKAEANDYVLSPYSGEISNIGDKSCGKYILIEHKLKDDIFYSEICGINSDILTAVGYNVRSGEKIAKCSNTEVTVKFLKQDKRTTYNLMSVASLILTDKKTTEKKDNKQEKKDNKQEKKDNKQEKKEKINTSSDGKSNFWDDVADYEKPKDVPNIFSSLLLTPASFFGKALTSKGGKNLKEEIDRIKELLK